MKYNFKKIESKWQKYWAKHPELWQAEDFSKKPKQYILVEFPYPSGEGLHVGHVRSYSAIDALARKKRMQGFNVLYPIGWDAFGLPTENYAIKTGVHPRIATDKNIANYRKQIKSLGISFDWTREIDTTDPEYYRWTQWIFLKFFEKGLAYQAEMPINWCPSCKIGLANEEAVGGVCERCGALTEKRNIKQWILKITAYADRLIDDLEEVDYLEKIKTQQINWIGRSYGTDVDFKIKDTDKKITIFTTRVDTIFGVTALVLAPENKIIEELKDKVENWSEVEKYINAAKKKTEIERTSEEKERSGVQIKGLKVINPANQEEVSLWLGDYVVPTYGGGAVMMVPAHDKRDWDFARKYNLPIKVVILNESASRRSSEESPANVGNGLGQTERSFSAGADQDDKDKAFVEDGILADSGDFNGLTSEQAREKITKWLKQKGLGQSAKHYKLRDWIFSRQHYWGEPIPIIHCEKCKNKKYKYILIHGYVGSSQDAFLPELKRQLEKDGHQVFSPDLPNPDKPNVEEQVEFILKNTEIDKNTIIIGWSLGGVVAMRLLEKTRTKIHKLILVDSFLEPEFIDHPRTAVKESFGWKFDFKKIKANADEIVLLADKTHAVIPENQILEFSKNLDAYVRLVMPEISHFEGKKEPEVIDTARESGIYPVSEKDLPVELPYVEKYQPTGTGESPLAAISEWVNVKCPKCGGPAKRETDTMPNWAGSSWYFLRYTDPRNNEKFAEPDKLKYWLPVDLYNGGMEHTTLHLLYSRFWHKFLFDLGYVPTPESYTRRRSHGIVLAEDNQKMSKSRGNVINPDDIVKEYGADSLRAYEMFMGPFDQTISWNTNGLVGCFRFLNRVWDIFGDKKKIGESSKEAKAKINQLIKKIGEDLEAMKFNTAIAAFMEFQNFWSGTTLVQEDAENFVKILAPFVPHLAEEIWSEKLGHKESIFVEKWPEYDPALIKEETIELVVQINGKVRQTLTAPADIGEEEAKKLALDDAKIKTWLAGQEPKKVIFVKGRLINIVI